MTSSPPVSKNYPLLLAGQFLGAFGDNFLLAAILAPLTYALAKGATTEAAINGQNAIFGLVFSIPFIALAPVAGFLSDRMPKTAWLVGGNLVKLLGTLLGLAAVTSMGTAASHGAQVAAYTVVGIGACLYSPAKYGILPEIVPNDRLVKANGAVEMLTLVAIVGGLMGGAVLYDATLSVAVCYGVACALYAAALGLAASMARTPCNPTASFRHSIGQFFASAAALLGRARIAWIILGSALFWFAGATLRSALQGWGLLVFSQAGVAHVTNLKLVLLKLGLVAGIVFGSWLAGIRHRTSDLAWATRYALLLALAIAGLGILGGKFGLTPVVLVLVVTGAAAGLLVVPFNAALQSETDPARLGKTVSLQNLTDYIGIAAGAAFLSYLSRFSLTANQDLLVLGAAVAAIAGLVAVLSRGSAPQALGSQPGS